MRKDLKELLKHLVDLRSTNMRRDYEEEIKLKREKKRNGPFLYRWENIGP
jgi:hypothetical protein